MVSWGGVSTTYPLLCSQKRKKTLTRLRLRPFELPLGIAPGGRSKNLTQHEQVYGNKKSNMFRFLISCCTVAVCVYVIIDDVQAAPQALADESARDAAQRVEKGVNLKGLLSESPSSEFREPIPTWQPVGL